MSIAIVLLSNDERFLQFLDPELCDLKETCEANGLRTLDFTYQFQNLHEDKQMFKIGNKVWVSGDTNLTDCLYVINTPLEVDVYQENSFHCNMEEVLVELNYAPLFTQNELKASNGFHMTTENGQQAVKVDWNALHYWFSDYFNIGVVQDCLNKEYNKISFNGTQTLMGLLRYIEEETGNVFITRYEKDILNNTIHRYLDFLNPLDVSKDWVLNVEYEFVNESDTGDGVYDADGNPTTDEYEDVENEDDIVNFDDADYTVIHNIDPTHTELRITNESGLVLNSDGLEYTEEDETPLVWSATEIGWDGTETDVVIQLSMKHSTLGLTCNDKSFVMPAVTTAGVTPKSFVAVENEPSPITNTTLPDDCYLEIYDTTKAQAVYRTLINREIGHVHEEVLDFGFNLENVTFETDEEDTYTAISPVLSLDDDSMTRTDMSTLISNWQGLEIQQTEIIPMIVEKVMVQAESLNDAKTSLGTYNRHSNYWSRPFHPQDQIDGSNISNNKWEFYRATAYWRAPFTKRAGDLHITTPSYYDTEYTTIYGRPDIRQEYYRNTPKMGTVETSDENIFSIYNDVALKLKDKMNREFNIEVDVANLLRKGEFNNYELYDKVYVKLPDYTELVTARVVKTTKEAHDVAKNTVELSNFTNNNVKVVQNETIIHANNTSFKYPNKKQYKVRLENADYDPYDTYSVQYPANKLVTFTLWKVENNQKTLTKTSYNKKTDSKGYATVNLDYDPGNYELSITFGGDEEYEDCSATVKVNVSGVKEIVNPVNNSKYKPKELTSKQKTTKKTKAAKTKSTKRYYSKYGVSPDEKYLMAVGRPSAGGELGKYGYKYYKVVFVRKCPFCGSKELYWNIFWTGNEHGSWGKNPAVGRRKSGSAEGEITCKKCDADFSIFGKDKANTARKNLKVYKKPVKCSKSEAYTLKKGKMYYDTITETVKETKVTSTKTRTSTATINKNVRNLALSIVGDSTGLAAAKKIAAWCGNRNNLRYDYYANFHRGPKRVMSKKGANCCDSARFMLTLMDAAGCTDKLKLQYVHVTSGAKGHVFAKVTTKSTGTWRYVDPVLKSKAPWGHWYKGCGTYVAHVSNYPDLPF